MTRGYFAIGIENGKDEKNVGCLLRSANVFDAAFVFTIGERYEHQAADTMHTPRHVPLLHFVDAAHLRECVRDARIVAIETPKSDPDKVWTEVSQYNHPPRGVYILGAEDKGLSKQALDVAQDCIYIGSAKSISMNVAVAGSVVIHDRFVKQANVV